MRMNLGPNRCLLATRLWFESSDRLALSFGPRFTVKFHPSYKSSMAADYEDAIAPPLLGCLIH